MYCEFDLFSVGHSGCKLLCDQKDLFVLIGYYRVWKPYKILDCLEQGTSRWNIGYILTFTQ